ncbi:hypothetical protein [Kineococcus gypseus]|uniref:hypothetical protein n=1 Tax=Kineococcus gypseus TaxID=1637102 RepID=UPI003D7CA16D
MSHDDATREAAAPHGAEPVMELLSEHVPLSLILDIASPGGPRSAELLASEGLPEDEWWARS